MHKIYGPALTEVSPMYNAVLGFMDKSRTYVARLSSFDKYIVWRYSIGSASVNSLLINNKLSDNAPRWTYLFFKYYSNGPHFPIPNPFNQWREFFSHPDNYNRLPPITQIGIAGRVITAYINALQRIILGAPRVTQPFTVYKVSSRYPGLPSSKLELPTTIVQLPFNSSTISQYFNFAPFLAPTSDCCLFNIELPRGSQCLYIPDDFHAYNFEHEIIFPVGAQFKITDITRETLNYIDPGSVQLVQLQDKDKIQIGPVYTLNEYFPCGPQGCKIDRKLFSVYHTLYLNPR